MFKNKTLLLFLVLLILIVALSAYGLATGVPIPFIGAGSGGGAEAPVAAGTPQARALAGQVFVYGDGSYSISEVKMLENVGAGTAQRRARGQFVTLTLRVTNTGRTPLAFAPADFTLSDRSGRVYTVDVDASAAGTPAGDASIFRSEVQPGLTATAMLAFDVPADAKGLRLRLARGFTEIELGQ